MITAAIQAIRRESRALWLRFEIHETEAYLRDCAADGLIRSLHIDLWNDRLAEMRCELATLAPPLQTHAPASVFVNTEGQP